MRHGLIVDVETTGLAAATDEIIELALLPFTYGLDGQVYEVLEGYGGLREPSLPLPADITQITGLTARMLERQRLDDDAIDRLVKRADLIIAHNAAFDRVFCERYRDVFATRPWACSMDEVPWRTGGFEGRGLSTIAAGHRLFFDGHRAMDDAQATLEVLSRVLPDTATPALRALLDSARRVTVRLWAIDAPFAKKDDLKARGYRWSSGEDGQPRAWRTDVTEDAADAEALYLTAHVLPAGVAPRRQRITALDRYSLRG